MVQKRLLIPARMRHLPTQFSWLDQRLVRGAFIDRCGPDALALYLFLVTVADGDGLSYYGDASVARRLQLDPRRLAAAREELIAADLVAWQPPLYQVLALPEQVPPAHRSYVPTEPYVGDRGDGERHVAEILRSLAKQR